MLTKFGKLLTLRYEHDHIKAEVDPLGEAGKLLAETTIEKQKEHIGRVLVDERRRVVVFLDANTARIAVLYRAGGELTLVETTA